MLFLSKKKTIYWHHAAVAILLVSNKYWEQKWFLILFFSFRVDGGLSENNFICQLLADLTDLPIIRLYMPDIAVLGVSYVAGLSCGKNNL